VKNFFTWRLTGVTLKMEVVVTSPHSRAGQYALKTTSEVVMFQLVPDFRGKKTPRMMSRTLRADSDGIEKRSNHFRVCSPRPKPQSP